MSSDPPKRGIGEKLIAVDPGLRGALACYDPAAGRMDILAMPVQQIVLKGKPKKDGKRPSRDVIDEVELACTLRLFVDLGYRRLFIERVGGMPGQSAPNAFTFGYGCGLVVGAARVLDMTIERCEPSIWKTRMRVPSDKREARKRASEMMPELAHHWPLQKDDGKAEAALLALYGELITRAGR